MRVPLPLVLLLAGCSAGPDRVSAEPSAAPETRLEIEVRASAEARPRSWTLTCAPPGGDHPDPRSACADLERADAPFTPVPRDALCTEVYGGPQTAVVRGTSDGRPVALELSRTDGCRTAQWDGLGAVLPDGS